MCIRSEGKELPLWPDSRHVFTFLLSFERLTGAIQELPLPLTHLNRVNGAIGADLLDRLGTTNRLHGDHDLEFGTVATALTYRGESRSEAMCRNSG